MIANPLQRLRKIAQQEINAALKQFEKDGLLRVMGKTLDTSSLLKKAGLDPQQTHECKVALLIGPKGVELVLRPVKPPEDEKEPEGKSVRGKSTKEKGKK